MRFRSNFAYAFDLSQSLRVGQWEGLFLMDQGYLPGSIQVDRDLHDGFYTAITRRYQKRIVFGKTFDQTFFLRTK